MSAGICRICHCEVALNEKTGKCRKHKNKILGGTCEGSGRSAMQEHLHTPYSADSVIEQYMEEDDDLDGNLVLFVVLASTILGLLIVSLVTCGFTGC